MSTVFRARRASVVLSVLMLISILSPLVIAGGSSGTITTFADGSTSAQVNLNGSSLNSEVELTLERNTTINSATFDIGYSTASPSPGTVTLDFGQDGQYEWAWNMPGFGDLGNQTTFSDGSATNSTTVDQNGTQLGTVLLPSTAQLQIADLNVEYSPDFGGAWVATGMIDDLEVGDIDADNLPEPIFLQRAHIWANGSTSPAIGFFDWSPSTGFGSVSWQATCDGAFSIEVGEFDGDGRTDVVGFDLGNNSACIHISTPSGGWNTFTNLSLGSELSDIETGDLDGDGDDELVSIHGASGYLREFIFNPNNGSFGGGASTIVNSNATAQPANLVSLAIGQFWGSGNATVAVSDDDMFGHVTLWNSTQGFWIPLMSNYSFDCIKSGMTTLDWNGDGLLDLIGDADAGTCISTFSGSGWSTLQNSLSVYQNYTVGDWNGNGSDDLLQPITGIVDGNDSTFVGYLEVHGFTSNSSIESTSRFLSPHTAPREIILADLDGDGLVEHLVSAGESTMGLYLAGWHDVFFDFDGDNQEEGRLVGYAGDGQNGVDELTWFDMGNISQSLFGSVSSLPSQIMPYGIEMAMVMPQSTSNGRGTVLMKDMRCVYDATFTVDANPSTGNLSNALNMEMLPGSGPFDVALPFNSNAQGSLDLEALQIEWVEGMANQVFRPAPIISGHMVVWDEMESKHVVAIFWNPDAMIEPDWISYQVFRWVNGSAPVLNFPHTSTMNNMSIDDDNVSGTTWDYRVRTVYANGVYSNYSELLTVMVESLPEPDITPPNSVTNLTADDTPEDSGGYIDVSWTESVSEDVSWYAVYLESTLITDVTVLVEVANISAGNSTSLTLATMGDDTDQYVAVICGDHSGNVNWSVVVAGPVQSRNDSLRTSTITVEVITGEQSESPLAASTARVGLPIEITAELSTQGEPIVGALISIDLRSLGWVGIWNVTSQQADPPWVLNSQTDSEGKSMWNWSDWADMQTESPTLFGDFTQVTASYGGGYWAPTMQTVTPSSGSTVFESRVDATLDTDVSTVQLDQNGEGNVVAQLTSADSVEQSLLRGIVVEWALGNETNQATGASGQVTIGEDGTAVIPVHYPQGGELDLSVNTMSFQWLDLASDEHRVTILPPWQSSGGSGSNNGSNQNQEDPPLLPMEFSCVGTGWTLDENGTSSVMECAVHNPNQAMVNVDITVDTPTGMTLFVSPSTSLSLFSNQSKDIGLEMRALLGAPPGERQLVVGLHASAADNLPSDNTSYVNFTVVPLVAPDSGTPSDTADSAGFSTTMIAAIVALVVILLLGGFFGMRMMNRDEDEEEEEEWLEGYDDPEGSTADYRRAPPTDTKPLDDAPVTRGRPAASWTADEGGLPSRGKAGRRPSGRPAAATATPTHREASSWDDGYAEEEDYTQSENYNVDGDGVEWWKDELGVWWYRYPDEEEWAEFIE